jgi:uncharacterized protein YecT (DUF1311 family)
MNVGNARRWAASIRNFSLIALACVSFNLHAVDNPDAIDFVAQFTTRIAPIEQKLADAANDAEFQSAATASCVALEAELNAAYSQLLRALPEKSKTALRASQRQWLLFRQAETSFIDAHWTIQQSGTSSKISRVLLRNQLVKDRILELLSYQRDMPNK